jgi:hypothetical protein
MQVMGLNGFGVQPLRITSVRPEGASGASTVARSTGTGTSK